MQGGLNKLYGGNYLNDADNPLCHTLKVKLQFSMPSAGIAEIAKR